MRIVNGYFCRNCADVELAKKGIDPAHPTRAYIGGEEYVPPSAEGQRRLGLNEPQESGQVGTRLDLLA